MKPSKYWRIVDCGSWIGDVVWIGWCVWLHLVCFTHNMEYTMPRFSYKQLAQMISEMPADRQLDDVSILVGDDGEVYPAKGLSPIQNFSSVADVLDSGHMVIHF